MQPMMLGMLPRHRDSQQPHDRDHHDTACGLEHRVARKRARRARVAAGDARAEADQVHRRKREHRRDERQLGDQEQPVARVDQGRPIANEIDRVHDARSDQRAHADRAQHGEAPRRAAGVGERWFVAAAPRAREREHEPGQGADPSARRDQMHHVGGHAQPALDAAAASGVPGERRQRDVRAGGEQRAKRRPAARTRGESDEERGGQQRARGQIGRAHV